MPHFLRQPQIIAIPPQFTIAEPRANMVRAVPLSREHVSSNQKPQFKPLAKPPMDYLSRLVDHLNAYKTYPYDARTHREEGTVRMRFTLDRAGHVLSYQVAGSSGFPSLDDEAKDMIRRADPFPPMPQTIHADTLDLVVPLVFSLH